MEYRFEIYIYNLQGHTTKHVSTNKWVWPHRRCIHIQWDLSWVPSKEEGKHSCLEQVNHGGKYSGVKF